MGRTLEKKGANKNGVKRMVIVGLSLVLEVFLFIGAFRKLNEFVTIINALTRVVAVVLVLGIVSYRQTASIKMPWIILVLTLPVVGVAAFLMIGLTGSTRKLRKRYEEVDEKLFLHLADERAVLSELQERNADEGGVASYIARKANYPVYRGTDVTYYSMAADGLEAQLQDLREAEHFIFLEYHAIENAEAWQRIERVLVDRVNHGVEVRVIYDDVGSVFFVDMDFAKYLQGLGIDCQVFNPMGFGTRLVVNNRDHRKITVIDGKVGFVGGYNLANEYFNITHPYGDWKDTGIRLAGPAVDSLTVTFLEMWNVIKTRKLRDYFEDPTKYLRLAPAADGATGYVQPYADNPIDNEQVGEEVYISIINRADRYCYFMSPYLIISDEMFHAISLAAKRGVDVRIVTPGIPDKRIIYRLTRSFYGGLVNAGVRIFEWTPGFCHAKMCVSDDTIATCGTINLDFRSLYHNFENGCVLYECDAVTEIRKDFEETFGQCREVTEEYRGEKGRERLPDLVLKLFSGLL